ncbi:MAG: hypothetical protein QXQ49_03045, partial [Archaeoglobaceae archaeon]
GVKFVIEIYKKLPKESFELILRNMAVRDHLKEIWDQYMSYGKIEARSFDKVFEELFRFFFRPFELILFNEKVVKSIIPIQDIFVSRDLLSAYSEFMDSLFSHMRLSFQLFSEPLIEKTLPEKFIEEWKEYLRRFEVMHEIPYDFPFALPENAKNFLIDCLSHWNDFLAYYGKYRDLMKASFRRAVEKVCDFVGKAEFKSFEDFRNVFQDSLAKEFDSLLKSKEYLELQEKLFSVLFDHIYCLRRFLELLIENNPASPFATVSQIDEAYKRILDLRRKISELEKRVEFLEGEICSRNSKA